ncbi:hypothetical protein DIE22_27255 [Burkholderia sp. Bp9142]|nr:hypothetical protein DIE22_27255 [Burkholderia sp. Bp9142]RQR56947.1 hypothetical protein DIE21_00145 [Burkholderia sp. Bp9140]
MLTFCRQCRAPKGGRKPGVDPVACYRGMATAVTPIARLPAAHRVARAGSRWPGVPLPTGPCRLRPRLDSGLSRCRRTWRIRQTVTQFTHCPA